MRLVLAMAMLSMGGQAQAEGQAPSLNFNCEFALTTPDLKPMSKPTRVEISAHRSGKDLERIRVVDAGGILFPGGNMRIVKTSDAVRLEPVSIPAERPGVWRASVKGKKLIFDLDADGKSSVVHMTMTADPQNAKGEHVVIWNASHQPEGMPKPISGTGAGWCLPKLTESVAQ